MALLPINKPRDKDARTYERGVSRKKLSTNTYKNKGWEISHRLCLKNPRPGIEKLVSRFILAMIICGRTQCFDCEIRKENAR